MSANDAEVNWRGESNAANAVEKIEVDEDYDYEKEIAASSPKKSKKSKSKKRVIDLTKVKQNDEESADVPAKSPRRKPLQEIVLKDNGEPKIEPPDNVVEPLVTGRTPEQLRDLVLTFVRSSYIRKSGHAQPKLAQNSILVALHEKYIAREAFDPDPDVDLLTLHDSIVKKSSANLELLKYFIYLVYRDDFKTSKDETFNTFYSGFRTRAFTQLSDAMSKCGVVQPDYDLVLDVTKGIEAIKDNCQKIVDGELDNARNTTCCQICLKPATHYCCPGGIYCNVTCYELDGNHRIACKEEAVTAPLIIRNRKNNLEI